MVDAKLLTNISDIYLFLKRGLISKYWEGLSTECYARYVTNNNNEPTDAMLFRPYDCVKPTLSNLPYYKPYRLTFRYKVDLTKYSGRTNWVSHAIYAVISNGSNQIRFRIGMGMQSHPTSAVNWRLYSLLGYNTDNSYFDPSTELPSYYTYTDCESSNSSSNITLEVEFLIDIYKNLAGNTYANFHVIANYGSNVYHLLKNGVSVTQTDVNNITLADFMYTYSTDYGKMDSFVKEVVV